MTRTGLHHVTAVCRDGQRTVDFHTRVLGLRLVERAVNYDAPETYHLYFGDPVGSPGTQITCPEPRRAELGAGLPALPLGTVTRP